MIALLLVASAFAGQADFDKAAAIAAEEEGKADFAQALGMAMAYCTPKVPGCVAVVAKLRQDDLLQREWLSSHPETSDASAAPIDVRSDEEDDAEDYFAGYYAAMPAVVPPKTGLDHLGGYSDPGGEWKGVYVTGIKRSYPDAAYVCAVKDSLPVTGFGGPVAIANSDAPGTAIEPCPAAKVTDEGIFVPSGTTLRIAHLTAPGVYSVEAVYRCDQSWDFKGHVQEKYLMGCSPIRR